MYAHLHDGEGMRWAVHLCPLPSHVVCRADRDKATIRSLYKRLKDLERKVAHIADEDSRAPRGTGTALDVSSTSHTPQDDVGDHRDPLIPMIISPTSLTGEDLPKVEERNNETVNMVEKTVDDQTSDSPVLKEELYVSDSDALNTPSSSAAEGATEFGARATEELKQDKRNSTDAEERGHDALDADDSVATKRVESAEGEREPDKKAMTAQEARVKRMRDRFLKMKNLIDGEDSGLLWTAEDKSVQPVEGNSRTALLLL